MPTITRIEALNGNKMILQNEKKKLKKNVWKFICEFYC